MAMEDAQTSLLARFTELSNHAEYGVAQPVLLILIELVSGSNEQQLEKIIEAGLLDAIKKGLNSTWEYGKILYKLLENTYLSTVQFEICLKADIVKLMSQFNGGNGPLACRAATVKANFD